MIQAQQRTAEEEIAKRTAEAGAGILAALKAGAMGDHLALLGDARLRVKEANRMGAKILGMEDVIDKYEDKAGEDMQSIMVTGDIVTHVHSEPQAQPAPTAPVLASPTAPVLAKVDTAPKPVSPTILITEANASPTAPVANGKSKVDWKVPAIIAAGMLASGGLGAGIPWLAGAYGPSTSTSTNNTTVSEDRQLYDLRIVRERK